MGSSPSTDQEKRGQRRMGVRLPIALEWRPEPGLIRRSRGITRDISRHGVYCYTDEPVPEGQAVDFDVVFPSEFTATTPMALHCKATTVRSETKERRFGIAAKVQIRHPIELDEEGPEAGRRARRRVRPTEEISVDYPGLRAVVRDVSVLGAFIEDERPLPVGRVVELLIRLSGGKRALQLKAVVRRVDPQVGMAVEFTTLSEEAAACLQNMAGDHQANPS